MPVAETPKVAACPVGTVALAGCVTIEGAVALVPPEPPLETPAQAASHPAAHKTAVCNPKRLLRIGTTPEIY